MTTFFSSVLSSLSFGTSGNGCIGGGPDVCIDPSGLGLEGHIGWGKPIETSCCTELLVLCCCLDQLQHSVVQALCLVLIQQAHQQLAPVV